MCVGDGKAVTGEALSCHGNHRQDVYVSGFPFVPRQGVGMGGSQASHLKPLIHKWQEELGQRYNE